MKIRLPLPLRAPWAPLWVAAGILFVLGLLPILVLSRLGILAWALLAGVLSLLLAYVAFQVIRRLMWGVGGRLALTYFLIGVLPIPMVLFLVVVMAYLLAGFFLGHLYRDAVATLHQELVTAAETRLAAAGHAIPPLPGFAFSYYEDGERLMGDTRTPLSWPTWLAARTPTQGPLADRYEVHPPLVALEQDAPSLAVAVGSTESGVIAFFDGDLNARLQETTQVRIELLPQEQSGIRLAVLGERFVLQLPRRSEAGLLINGLEAAGPLVDFVTGEEIHAALSANLAAPPGVVSRQFFSRKVDTGAWGLFIIIAFLLFDIYTLAAYLAVRMIVGLSRAVNRLSRATAGVQAGDFSTRISVERGDQVGALQQSFNQMAANLEELIQTAAQKEVLEKELEIARELQESLLPSEVLGGKDVEFATFFEPSAAIGGDYFDILPLRDNRLAVVIADVSGHGLPAGLRMAMIKAALLILVQENAEPQEILQRLDGLIRHNPDSRPSFVTSTLARLDLGSGRLELTNAGHPPTYHLRNGNVEEILLPSPPLGALPHRRYATQVLSLEPGDTVVWLSDGFPEAANPQGEPFGYEETARALGGASLEPRDVRDRLLKAVHLHTGQRPADDDRTLVVMRYHSPSSPRSA